MKVLGIDPGLTTLGYAVVARAEGRFDVAAIGCLKTTSSTPVELRLAQLRRGVVEVIEEHAPDVAAIERLFFNANVRTAMSVGQASGVTLASAAEAGLEVFHYTPTEVKQSVVGYGGASKKQVGSMVASLLGLETPPRPSDAADACALAICHLNRSGLSRAIRRALG